MVKTVNRMISCNYATGVGVVQTHLQTEKIEGAESVAADVFFSLSCFLGLANLLHLLGIKNNLGLVNG